MKTLLPMVSSSSQVSLPLVSFQVWVSFHLVSLLYPLVLLDPYVLDLLCLFSSWAVLLVSFPRLASLLSTYLVNRQISFYLISFWDLFSFWFTCEWFLWFLVGLWFFTSVPLLISLLFVLLCFCACCSTLPYWTEGLYFIAECPTCWSLCTLPRSCFSAWNWGRNALNNLILINNRNKWKRAKITAQQFGTVYFDLHRNCSFMKTLEPLSWQEGR